MTTRETTPRVGGAAPGGSPEAGTAEWYRQYYERKGADRNDLLRNPEVLFQVLAMERSVIEALRSMDLDPGVSSVLDVGCGSCGSLASLLRLGFHPSRPHGIDILEHRIAEARARLPHLQFQVGDAARMPFPDGAFDLVMEWTMFVQLTDEDLAARIAREMLRVTRPGGYLLLVDWRYSKPGDAGYRGLSLERVRRLLEVGSASSLHCVRRGALVPPVGRLLSRRLPAAYFLVQSVLPFLVGQVAVGVRRAVSLPPRIDPGCRTN